MKRLLFTLSTLFMTVVSFSQSSNLQKFVGVWNPSTEEGRYGRMKISMQDGGLLIQIKSWDGILTFNNIDVNGDELTFGYVESENHGRFTVGTWRGATWYGETCIIENHDDGSQSSPGPPTHIYATRTAFVEKTNTTFKAVYKNGNIDLYFGGCTEYCDYSGQVLFDQCSNANIFYRTYINW